VASQSEVLGPAFGDGIGGIRGATGERLEVCTDLMRDFVRPHHPSSIDRGRQVSADCLGNDRFVVSSGHKVREQLTSTTHGDLLRTPFVSVGPATVAA
jgi:hypothetical protein